MDRRLLVSQIVVGVPLAAFLHCVIQWVAAGDGRGGPAFFLVYWLSAIAVGGPVVLAPSFVLQAVLVGFLRGRGVSSFGQTVVAGVLQAGIVWVWSLVVGI